MPRMTTAPAGRIQRIARAALLTICLPALASRTLAQCGTSPAFDVATIKVHQGIFQLMGLEYQPDGFTGTVTLSMLVQYAYGLRSTDQVSGGPDWAKSDWFDIQAKMSEADIAETEKLSADEIQTRRERMLQALLAERFHLTTHSSTRQSRVYELVVAKSGPKLKDAATDTSDHLLKGEDGKPLTGFLRFLKNTSVAQGYPMSALADFLSQPLAGVGRPVLDKTGLTGTYDFTLDWSPPHPGVRLGAESDSASPEDAPSIFTALGEVGLKLQPATDPIDTIVIDHVEKPSAN